MTVALTHFTSTYYEIYNLQAPGIFANFAKPAVSLFFMISGFVILMTLDRCRTIADFAVSRFARLYPVFWACVAVTFLITRFANLPLRQVSLQAALLNLTMVPSFLKVPSVDVVYWTLHVELSFYVILCIIVKTGLRPYLNHIVSVLALAGAVNYHFPLDKLMPTGGYRIETMLILDYWPSFLIGIVIFEARNGFRKSHALTLAIALVAASLQELSQGVVHFGLAVIMWLATSSGIPGLTTKPLLFLGKISYSFYLIHANVGYCIIRVILSLGWSVYLAAVVALAGTLCLASALCFLIEKPSNSLIRRAWKNRMLAPEIAP